MTYDDFAGFKIGFVLHKKVSADYTDFTDFGYITATESTNSRIQGRKYARTQGHKNVEILRLRLRMTKQ